MTLPAPTGFLFDLNRCTGCHACELACSTENELGWGQSWRRVVTYNEPRRPATASYHLSLACHHCLEAPCEARCPALAIGRDPATIAVLIDDAKCLGCRYCHWVCPYDAPRFDKGRGVMTKCTACHHRLVEGREPACVEQCPTSALGYGELDGGETAVPGFPDTPAGPAIRFTLRREGLRPPETTWELSADVQQSFDAARPPRARSASLANEWPLWLFTLLVSALAGWMLAAAGGGPSPPLLLFAAGAGVTAATSTLHLGRKRRMWRAVLNVRRSWLSREILSFGAFCAASLAHLAWPELPAGGVLSAALALATLFSIDRVYDPVRPAGPRVHSADTLLTGALFGALLGHHLEAAAGLALAKLFLYVSRLGSEGVSSRAWAWGGLRILGLLPVIPMAVPSSGPAAVVLWLALAAGEAIDRAQFYERLETTGRGDPLDTPAPAS